MLPIFNRLNYQHLFYFWQISRHASISAGARALRLSQSTLSEQLRLLEDQLGVQLFERTTRKMILTHAGQVALQAAEKIFNTGDELVRAIHGERPHLSALRMGAIGALSKNLQMRLIRPLLSERETNPPPILVIEGTLSSLLSELNQHHIDLVISNMMARTDLEPHLHHQELCRLPVSIVGHPKFKSAKDYRVLSDPNVAVFLPTYASQLRDEIQSFFGRKRIKPRIAAEIEDMALLRLLARSGKGLAIVPDIVVQEELAGGRLIRIQPLPEIVETIYAITRAPGVRPRIVERVLEAFSLDGEPPRHKMRKPRL